MDNGRNKWVEAIAKLIELTQHNSLEWKAEPPPGNLNTEPGELVDVVFVTTYLGKKLRLYRKKVRVDDSGIRNLPKVFGMAGALPDWDEMSVLEFVDEENHSLWSVPYVSILEDLLSAVKFQVAGIQDFLGDILAEE